MMTTEPTLLPNRSVAGSSSHCGRVRRVVLGMAGISRVKFTLIFFTIGIGCNQLGGATNNTTYDGKRIAQPGSIQWEIDRQAAKQRQELYRKRILIPTDAFSPDIPTMNGAIAADQARRVAAPIPVPAAPLGLFSRLLLFLAVLVATALIGLKKFAPHVLVAYWQRFSPWIIAPGLAEAIGQKNRSEEEAFSQFVATFRIGPNGAPASQAASGGQDDSSKTFYANAIRLLGVQRGLLRDINAEPDDLARQKMLADLHAEMSTLKGEAVFPRVLPIWQVASAMEGLLKQFAGKIGSATPSALRTVQGGLDLLDELCHPGLKIELLPQLALKFLIVDDDLISRHAMSLALKKAFGEPDVAVDGETALAKVSQQTYDVIFLDVQMPGMDGFELCTKIRASGLNSATPVIFVTSQSDYEARTQSTLSGGNDLMGKPFLIFEITVKALTFALQNRLRQIPKSADANPNEAGRWGKAGADSAKKTSVPELSTEDFTNEISYHTAAQVGPLQDFCRIILEISDEAARQNLLADALLRISSLISKKVSEARQPTTQMCSAIEGLIKKMLQNTKHSTPSALATLTAAIDLLTDLCDPGLKSARILNQPINILVVDDDLVTRRIIVGALQTFFTRPESVENGEEALHKTADKHYDVIFMDLMMPGMNGFETCHKIREHTLNRTTPVVFVTSQDDFQTRAQSSENHGSDLLGKPFLIAEIIVKALTFAQRNRLKQLETEARK